MRRRVISVTRRHLAFLFGTSNVKQVRAVERIIQRNREETVVTSKAVGWILDDSGAASFVAFEGHDEWFPAAECFRGEGDWQLPPSDESKVGDDV